MFPLKEIEDGILSYLEKTYSSTIFNLWLKDLSLFEMTEDKIVFEIQSAFKKKIIETQYLEEIEKAVNEVCGYPFPVHFILNQAEEASVSSPEDTQVEKKENEDLLQETFFFEKEEEKKEDIGPSIESPSIVRDYTFENFIVGESNKFAHAAAIAVSRGMVENYNPLFIYGQSGLGKTHLLYAITNEIKKNNPTVKIVYKKGDEFTNELIEAIQKGSTSSFHEKYRSSDVLLIDDIQFIAGKESTQEEFFHTFCALYEAEKQIILTSDRPPKEIRTLEERLRTRFEGGLIADIQPPSIELRTAIIRKKAEKYKLHLSSDMVSYMAQNIKSSIRQIEGAIKKISAFAVLYGEEPSEEKIKQVVAEFATISVSPDEVISKIFSSIEKKYGISREDIQSKKRTESITAARHIAAYLIRNLTDFPFAKIGEILNRDHTTVISSCAAVDEKMKKDNKYENEINEMIHISKN